MTLRRMFSELCLLLGLLLLAACGRAPELDRLAAGETGTVREVVSGHYLVLEDGLEVRLVGLLAPKYDEPYADESAALLTKLAEGQAVQLYYGGKRRDSYGRALAHVKLTKDGVWLQKALLKAGAARVRMYPDNRALAGPMLEAEASARNGGKGLWASKDYQVLLPEEAVGADGFVIVEGRPMRVDLSDGEIHLGFSGGLNAYVSERDRPAFDRADLTTKLSGALVRLRGMAGSGDLRLDMPEQVEVLKAKP
ncbi:MAG: thermonuclease family protein [Caulobacteraceae bacterium]